MTAATTANPNNSKISRNTIKLIAFTLLVMITVLLAAQVSNIAAEVNSKPIPATIHRSWVDLQDDPMGYLEMFCYKSCSFMR